MKKHAIEISHETAIQTLCFELHWDVTIYLKRAKRAAEETMKKKKKKDARTHTHTLFIHTYVFM